MNTIPVVIPAYEPDEKLIYLINSLIEAKISPIIVVNDGSSALYDEVFEKVKVALGQCGRVLVHKTNQGKGSALKTAFKYVLENYPNALGIVTADSDGQHTISSILKIRSELNENPNSLVLGVRNFTEKGIPWKSRFGNTLTKKIFSYVVGVHISDTQTGLRGIPKNFMKELLLVPGKRFEFETQMLMETNGKYPIREVSIETIYESQENHQTHFRPITDSIKIYRTFGRKFLRFIFSSLSSCVLDLILFSIFCYGLKKGFPEIYVAVSTVFARVISASYNYMLNYKMVFKSQEKMGKSALKYVILAAIQMSLSALFVTIGVILIPVVLEVWVKAVIDTALFFVSYRVQQKHVFKDIRA